MTMDRWFLFTDGIDTASEYIVELGYRKVEWTCGRHTLGDGMERALGGIFGGTQVGREKR